MTALRRVEFERAISLEMEGFGIVGGEENEGGVERNGMAGPRKR